MKYVHMQKFLRIIVAFFITAHFFAGNVRAQDTLDFEEIKVIAPYEPAISDAFKIADSPVIEDTVRISKDLAYDITPVKLQTTFDIQPIDAARMRGEPLTKLYRGHVRGGFGTHSTPYGEAFLNSLRSNEYAYGLRLMHLSSAGQVKDFPHSGYSDNLAEVFATRFFRNHILDAGIDYERNVVHFYGTRKDDFLDYDNDIYEEFEDLTIKDSIRQRYHYFSANTGFRNNTMDSLELSYDFDVNYNFLKDDYDATEQIINISSTFQRQLPPDPMEFAENQHFKLNVHADIFNNRSPLNSIKSNIFGIRPRLSSSYRDFEFYLGFNAAFKTDSVTYFRIHPVAGTEVNLIDGVLAAYGYLTGGIERHNLYDFYRKNPFLNTELDYRFRNMKSEIGGGFKGSISSYVSYNISVRNSTIENYAFFVTDFETELNNKLTVVYDDVRLFNFRAEIFSQVAERLNIRFASNYYEYSLDNEIEAWHTPTTRLDLSVRYNIRDKIILSADAFARNSWFARVFDEDGNPERKEIHGFHVDANIGIEYRYTKLLSVFLNFNNVQNQPLERWMNYPSQRFNFLGGVTYSF